MGSTNAADFSAEREKNVDIALAIEFLEGRPE
jgi:hypothetical protein